MNSYGLGLGMLLAGLVFFIGARDASRRCTPATVSLPRVPKTNDSPMIRLYERHPEYLRSLRAVQA